MIVVDPGHEYRLNHLDGHDREKLVFVKREGPGYSGNVGHHEGTNIQEVLRALIDRVEYLDNQVPDNANVVILQYLRQSIWFLEERAARRHGRTLDVRVDNIEKQPMCKLCGHIGCEPAGHEFPKDATCEETTGMIGDSYIRCGKPAVVLIQHVGRDEGPYYMCMGCAQHNVRNRDAVVLRSRV